MQVCESVVPSQASDWLYVFCCLFVLFYIFMFSDHLGPFLIIVMILLENLELACIGAVD